MKKLKTKGAQTAMNNGAELESNTKWTQLSVLLPPLILFPWIRVSFVNKKDLLECFILANLFFFRFEREGLKLMTNQ